MNRPKSSDASDDAWEAWGARDPYYAVLARTEFRLNVLTADTKEEFFAEGRRHAEFVRGRLEALLPGAPLQLRRILDFGCGVGRLLVPFATMADEVVGLDVSPSMLDEARRNCSERAANNVTLALSDDALSGAAGQFDLVHSSIVLQHIDPERGRKLFAALVAKVRSGGFGALHVSYGWSAFADRMGQPPLPEHPRGMLQRAAARLKGAARGMRWSRKGASSRHVPVVEPSPDPPMLMHWYNLSELAFMLQAAGVRSVHADFTDHGGAFGAFLFFIKPRYAEDDASPIATGSKT